MYSNRESSKLGSLVINYNAKGSISLEPSASRRSKRIFSSRKSNGLGNPSSLGSGVKCSGRLRAKTSSRPRGMCISRESNRLDNLLLRNNAITASRLEAYARDLGS